MFGNMGKDSREDGYTEIYVDRLPFHLPETEAEKAVLRKYKNGQTLGGFFLAALFVLIQIIIAVREHAVPDSVPSAQSKIVILAVLIVIVLVVTIIGRVKNQSAVMYIAKVTINNKTAESHAGKHRRTSCYVDVTDEENKTLVKKLSIGTFDFSVCSIGTSAYVIKNYDAYKVVL